MWHDHELTESKVANLFSIRHGRILFSLCQDLNLTCDELKAMI